MTRTAPTPTTPAEPRAGVREWLGLVVLMLPVILVSVDNTVLSFALPLISRAIEPTAAAQLWIVDAYPLVLAGLLVAMGSAGDRIGRRRILMIGAFGFAVLSVLAAFSPTAEMLIAARAALGLFGAMLMPATLSLLRSLFVDREQRRLAVAVWATGFAGGGALGPIVGGVLLEHFWWGSVFLLAVPVLIPLLILAPLLVRESRDPAPGPIDPVSIVLSLVTMLPIVYGIKTLAIEGLASLAAPAIVVGLIAGVWFVRRQLRRRNPMLDVRLFGRGMFSGAVLVNLFSVIALTGFLFFVSQHLQLSLGLTPVDAGLVLLPGLIAMVAAGLLIVPIARRLSPRVVIPSALMLSAAGYLVIGLYASGGASIGVVMVSWTLLGIGIGAAETVSNELILSAAPAAKVGAASAVSETAYEVGAVLGTALLGSIVVISYRANLVLSGPISPADRSEARETLAGAVNVAGTLPPRAGDDLIASASAAFDSGVTVTSLIAVGLMIAAAAVGAFSLKPSRPDRPRR